MAAFSTLMATAGRSRSASSPGSSPERGQVGGAPITGTPGMAGPRPDSRKKAATARTMMPTPAAASWTRVVNHTPLLGSTGAPKEPWVIAACRDRLPLLKGRKSSLFAAWGSYHARARNDRLSALSALDGSYDDREHRIRS